MPGGRDGLLRRLAPVCAPILFAAYPLLSLYADNQTEVELGVLWWPLALCVGAAVLLYGVFLLIFKRGAKAGALASLVVAGFSFYGIYSEKLSGSGLGDRWFLALWAAFFVLGAYALVRTRRDLASLTLGLTVGAVVLVVGPVARIAIYESNQPSLAVSDSDLWPTDLPNPVPPSGARLPDIYFLIPDDYARQDVLKRYFRYDNARFIGQLRKRGFVISPQSRSPYSDSEMNIAAAVNMDYLSRLTSLLGTDSQDVRPVRRLIHDNRASRLLESLGYRYVHLDSDEVTFPAGNPHISPVATPDTFMTLWMQQSVLSEVGGSIGFNEAATNERFRKTIRSAFSGLAAVPSEPGPKFVLFHTLMPHDPYIFGPHGESITFPDHSDEGHTTKLGMKYYVKQAQFTETKLLAATDAILARSKQPPIILIQADEGFEASEDDWGLATVRDMRVKGIAALYLPGEGKARPPEKLNTVNTLRFIFNRYFGTRYPLLRNASYPELDLPYQFKEMPVR
jgi:hypothetical protein